MLKYHILLSSILCLGNVHASQTSNSPQDEASSTLIAPSLGEDSYSWLEDPLWSVGFARIQDEKISDVAMDENAAADKFFLPLMNFREKVEDLIEKLEFPEKEESVKVGDKYYSHEECEETGATKIYVSSKSCPLPHEKKLVLNLSELNPYSEEDSGEEDYTVSPDGRYLIYGFDAYGWGRYYVGIYDVESKKHLEEKLYLGDVDAVWHAGPTQGFYYTSFNQASVCWHAYNQPQQNDTLIYQDHEKFLSLVPSSDGKNVFLGVTDHKDEDEIFVVTANHQLVKILDSQELMKSEGIDSIGTTIFLALNDQNSRGLLRKVIVEENTVIESKNLMNPTADVLFKDVKSNVHGLIAIATSPEGDSLWMFDTAGQNVGKLSIDSLLQKQIGFDSYQDFHSERVALQYNSLSAIKSLGFLSMTASTFQENEGALEGFNPKAYKHETLYVESEDGLKVPVTVAYNPSKLSPSKDNVLILSAYGAYGEREELCADASNIVLMNAGVILAHAHVRGGGAYGPQWHEGGKLLNKKKSFADFLSVADFLVRENWVKNENLVAQGGSAGGIIMGYIANNAPTKFKAILMDLPFLCVYRDSHNSALWLTAHEKWEWGDVSIPGHAEYIHSYCPYENIRKQAYPAMMIHYGLYDNHVPYWNALKYVKKLKDHHTGENPIFAIEMKSGHELDLNSDLNKIIFLKALFGEKIEL